VVILLIFAVFLSVAYTTLNKLFAVFLYIILGGPEKTSRIFAWRYATEQVKWISRKHVCNEQTSSNVSIKFHVKRFHISRCIREIVLHVIKQCLQAVRHLCCWLYAGYTRTSQ